LEVVVGRDLALVRHNRRAERHDRRGVIGGRVVVRYGTADRAAMAHGRVADGADHLGEGRDGGLHHVGFGHLVMAGEGADDERIAGARDAPQLADPVQVDQHGRGGEAELHRGQERVAAGEELPFLVVRQHRGRLRQARRLEIFEGVHCPEALRSRRPVFAALAVDHGTTSAALPSAWSGRSQGPRRP
jgi:hypothetical protein